MKRFLILTILALGMTTAVAPLASADTEREQDRCFDRGKQQVKECQREFRDKNAQRDCREMAKESTKECLKETREKK